MKRIGQVPPIFAVSGKLACEAKRLATPCADLLTPAVTPCSRISFPATSAYRPRAGNALETWRGQAASALRCVEDRIEDQSRAINSQSRFIEQVEREIDDIREQFVTRLPRHLAGVAAVFETEGVWVTKLLAPPAPRLAVHPALVHRRPHRPGHGGRLHRAPASRRRSRRRARRRRSRRGLPHPLAGPRPPRPSRPGHRAPGRRPDRRNPDRCQKPLSSNASAARPARASAT